MIDRFFFKTETEKNCCSVGNLLGCQRWPLVVVFCRFGVLSGFCGSSQVCFPLGKIFSWCFLFACVLCVFFYIFLSTNSALVFVPFFCITCLLCCFAVFVFFLRLFLCLALVFALLWRFSGFVCFSCAFLLSPLPSPSIYMPMSCVDGYVCGAVFGFFAVLLCSFCSNKTPIPAVHCDVSNFNIFEY